MRFKAVALAGAGALAFTLTAAAPAGATGTAASGSVVVTESNAFLAQAAQNGIIIIPLPSATASYSSGTGASSTFPVTGGTGSLPQFFGDIQLGGGVLVVDAATHKSACFHDLDFSIVDYALEGVPDGGTASVPLVDVGGDTTVSSPGASPQTLTSNANIDPAGASYLNGALGTSLFSTDGLQVLGSIDVTFTPAS
jgi:hypothetical protein